MTFSLCQRFGDIASAFDTLRELANRFASSRLTVPNSATSYGRGGGVGRGLGVGDCLGGEVGVGVEVAVAVAVAVALAMAVAVGVGEGVPHWLKTSVVLFATPVSS